MRALAASVALLPALLTVYFGFESGGYFPGAPALVAAELAALVALRLAFARRPLEGVGPALLLAAAALGGFAAWALASSGWSDSPARALPEYTRALAYLLALVLFGILPFSVRRIRWMTYGLAAAIVVVCGAAFLSRTVPDLIGGAGELQPDRLSYPLDYWNALGLLAGIGVVLCGHLACASREHWAARVAGAAAVPLLTTTLYYTFSRGATWAALAGVALYVVVGRPRGLIPGALATVPPTLVALMVVNPAGTLTAGPRLAPETVATGHRTALAVLGCVVGAALIRAVLLPADTRLEAARLAPRLRRPLLAGAGVAALILALATSAALHVPDVVAEKYRDFSSDSSRVGESGSSRLLSASDNGRREHWEVALDEFRRDPLRGSGAGSYQTAWMRDRDSPAEARDGHSLYIETLGELGLVGLAALAVCLLLVLGGFARRARGRDRTLFAALLAAGAAWALEAGVDWAWEMPAVTIWLFALGGAALARRPSDRAPAPRSPDTRRTLRVAGVALRVAAVAACVALAVLPARLAVSEARVDRSIERLHAGDCDGARAAARGALDALDRRAVPHHVIGWCELRAGRFGAAARELSEALENDPHNWALRQASAVARARAGLDPRRDARLAVALNPRDTLARDTRAALRRGTRKSRRRAGRRLAVALPELGDR